MSTENKMPDEIWAIGNNGDAACGCGEWDDYSKDGTRYFSEPAIEQRAKVAVAKIRHQHAEFGVGAIHATDEQLATIILASLKGEMK